MTNTPDTSPEAVERLAKDHDEVGNSPEKYVMGHPHHWKTAATLRALSAELEVERTSHTATLKDAQADHARAEAAEAERDALKAGLAEAVERLRFYASHSNWEQMFAINADGLAHQSLGSPIGCDNGSKARAFLARHQKGQTND